MIMVIIIITMMTVISMYIIAITMRFSPGGHSEGVRPGAADWGRLVQQSLSCGEEEHQGGGEHHHQDHQDHDEQDGQDHDNQDYDDHDDDIHDGDIEYVRGCANHDCN